jgi:hypothetical protein
MGDSLKTTTATFTSRCLSQEEKKRICWLKVGVMLNTSAAFSPQGIFVFFKISTYECTITLCLRKTAMSEYRNVGVRNQLIA